MISGILVGILVGLALAVALWSALRSRRPRQRSGPNVQVLSSIEELRSIGELSVYKVMTKEIVTATDHWLGDAGQRYFEWMVSSKMALIIAFEIDFRFNLRAGDFGIKDQGERRYRLVMPKCLYNTHIKDIHFYDEQNSKLLPWLLPDLLNRAFGAGFSEQDKNRLIEEAKQQASKQAESLVSTMESDVQNSARQTLTALARGFGAAHVDVDFGGSRLVEARVDYDSAEAGDAA